MDAKLRRLNQLLKAYDRDLYVVKTESGMVQVHRYGGYSIQRYEIGGKSLGVLRPNSHFILALTDNWRLSGKPVDMGIDRVLDWFKEFDTHKNDDQYEKMVKNREREESDRERALSNELKARAYDMRRDFARATDDINTSTLEKIDRRRLKGA